MTPLTTRTVKPEKNTTGSPRPVPEDVQEKQDPEFSEDDFDRALFRATKRLGLRLPGKRGRGSSKT
jgi:hypothetical protein